MVTAVADYSPHRWNYLPQAQDQPEEVQDAVLVMDQQQKQQEKQEQRLASQIRLGISLDSMTDLDELRGQIQGMIALEKIDIYVEESFKRHPSRHSRNSNIDTTDEERLLEDNPLGRIAETIASLPNLNWLRIRSSSMVLMSRGKWAALPFSVLETLVKRCPALKYLLLHHIDFVRVDHTNEANSCWMEALACLLQDNNTIEELRIDHRFRKVSQAGQQALLTMLQYHNFTLECLDLDKPSLRHVSPLFKKEVAFWLAMNRKGLRRRLLSPMARTRPEEWRDAIVEQRKRTSVIYYLLSNNPTLLIQSPSA